MIRNDFIRKTAPLLLSFLFFSFAAAEEKFVPSKTYAVISGVLSWKNPSLASYSPENRKDAELAEKLTDLGVPADNITLLTEQQATREGILKAIAGTGKKAPEGSLFIFYYAGHGLNEGAQGMFFANYDIDLSSVTLTGLSSADIYKVIGENFKGKKVLLLADCCYSGFLEKTAVELGIAGIPATAITSASRSNASTGNWTFSQTVLAAFDGDPLADRDKNGFITLKELAEEVGDAMRFRERQMSGRYLPYQLENMVLAKAKKRTENADCGKFRLGRYVLDKAGETVRITDCPQSGDYELEYLTYNAADRKPAKPEELKEIFFRIFPAGSIVKVTWEGKVYEAKILKEENAFHLITYPGWDSSWDEWIMDDRIAPEDSEIYVSTGSAAEN